MQREVRRKARVKSPNEALSILENIDWSFNPKPSNPEKNILPFDARKYHSFPATFIPEIPFTLIEALTYPNSVVYDPFAGIGTTYFQAFLLGRTPFATEICEIAVNYMRNLQRLFDPTIDLNNIQAKTKGIIEDYTSNKSYIGYLPDDAQENLSPWFVEEVLNEISFIRKKEKECENTYVKSAMKIVISDILKELCSQDRGWGCIADNVHPKVEQLTNKDTLRRFKNKFKNLLKYIQKYRNILKENNNRLSTLYNKIKEGKNIIHGDIRDSRNLPHAKTDMVITSPPYPEMTDYTASQRLSYYWLGKDVGLSKGCSDMNKEIGARRKRGRNSSLMDYVEDMKKANATILKGVENGGYICYVLPFFGDGNGEKRKCVEEVIDQLEKNLTLYSEYNRNLPSNRRVHNVNWATLEKEKILLYRKEGK